MAVTGPEVEKARAFATHKHSGQKGKGPGQAYIDQVEAVVVALLVEHRPHQHRGAIREFGEDVAELVYWLTDPEDSEGA